jgi:hypothetical protein
MSTSAIPPLPATPGVSKTSLILAILTASLQGLSLVPVIGPEALAASYFIKIIQAATQAYHQETGQPIDLALIPQELPVP